MIHNSNEVAIKIILWFGSTTKRGTVLKHCRIRKFERHCSKKTKNTFNLGPTGCSRKGGGKKSGFAVSDVMAAEDASTFTKASLSGPQNSCALDPPSIWKPAMEEAETPDVLTDTTSTKASTPMEERILHTGPMSRE